MSIIRALTNPTKIICTIGPASDELSIVQAMIESGMDLARLNFSHGSHSDHEHMLKTVRKAAEKTGEQIGIIADLQGPKIRTGDLINGGPVTLEEGRQIEIVSDPHKEGTAERIYTTYDALSDDVNPGDRVLLDDGRLEISVQQVGDGIISGTVEVGGELGEYKGMNLPGVEVSARPLTAKDKEDLAFALEHGVDYLALSFVRTADELFELREACEARGCSVPIIAKLERPEALDELEAICQAADVIMVARGDLGVELAPEQVPVWQKRIIRLCSELRVPVITATQMLDSMRNNPQPTRAEASDVANAIFDGTDAVMLSGETAIGKYPVQTVTMMRRICATAEREQMLERGAKRTELRVSEEQVSIADAVVRSAVAAAERVEANALVAFTESGSTARMASKCRPSLPIIAVTPIAATARRCSLFWGVTPVHTERAAGTEEDIVRCVDELQELGMLSEGDIVVIMAGQPMGRPGTTNSMRIHRVGVDL
ncbi:MAG: pyruvate kinase [Armatimonadota bacterium]